MDESIKALAEKLGHTGCTRKEVFECEADTNDGDTNEEVEKKKLARFKPIPEVVIMKEPAFVSKKSESEKNRSIVKPKMLGLNSPEQDLH